MGYSAVSAVSVEVWNCWFFFNIFQSLPVEWIERTVLWSHKRHHTNSYNWIHHSSSSSKGMSYRTGQFLKDHLVNRSHSLTSSAAQGGGGSFKNRKPIGWKVECGADGLVPMRFCDVSSPPVWSTAPATKKWCQVVRSAAPVAQNHFNKPEDLMLQSANLLKKSAPGPPNSSDEHVSCTAPPRKLHLCRSSSSAPRLPSFLEMLQNPHVLLTFDKVHNPLRLPRETTSERPKEVQAPGVFNILTSKCASRHNRVHFFDISISKSGPSMVCFVHFDFEMCFAPQQRALFHHRNFQKWSGAGVFCTFWLRNVLRPTTACAFSSSQLPKVVRSWCALYILTWKCASRHNGVQFVISHLASWLRTRRFSEPTFRPSGATNHWKNAVFHYLFAHLDLLSSETFSFWSSFFFSSLTLPISAFHLSILSEVWLLNFLRLVVLVKNQRFHWTRSLSKRQFSSPARQWIRQIRDNKDK